MWRLWALAEHLNDTEASADPRLTGALVASLIVSVLMNWDFWLAAINLSIGAVRWLSDDSKLVLGMTLF